MLPRLAAPGSSGFGGSGLASRSRQATTSASSAVGSAPGLRSPPASPRSAASPSSSASASSSAISAAGFSSTIRHSRGRAGSLRCQLPGQRIGWTALFAVGSAPTRPHASERARFSRACSSGEAVGSFSRQWACSFVVHLARGRVGPGAAAGDDERRRPEDGAQGGQRLGGRSSSSTESVRPSSRLPSSAFSPAKSAIGGANTIGRRDLAAFVASSTAASISGSSPTPLMLTRRVVGGPSRLSSGKARRLAVPSLALAKMAATKRASCSRSGSRGPARASRAEFPCQPAQLAGDAVLGDEDRLGVGPAADREPLDLAGEPVELVGGTGRVGTTQGFTRPGGHALDCSSL